MYEHSAYWVSEIKYGKHLWLIYWTESNADRCVAKKRGDRPV
jgi:hypothetical protein